MKNKSTQLDNERTRNGTNIGSSWGCMPLVGIARIQITGKVDQIEKTKTNQELAQTELVDTNKKTK